MQSDCDNNHILVISVLHLLHPIRFFTKKQPFIGSTMLGSALFLLAACFHGPQCPLTRPASGSPPCASRRENSEIFEVPEELSCRPFRDQQALIDLYSGVGGSRHFDTFNNHLLYPTLLLMGQDEVENPSERPTKAVDPRCLPEQADVEILVCRFGTRWGFVGTSWSLELFVRKESAALPGPAPAAPRPKPPGGPQRHRVASVPAQGEFGALRWALRYH